MKENYKEYKLKNGLVVALQNTSTKTIISKLRVHFGSYYEMEGEEGIAHFLEHCLFSGGSQKYDPSQADEIRSSFGYSNAQTNLREISFLSGILQEDFEKWLDFTSQQLLHPRFDERMLEAERKRVLREIYDAKSDPSFDLMKEFNRLFYRSHPKGKFVLGKEEVILDADIEKIRSFYNRGFNPSNMDLIIAGGLPENVEKLVEHYFGEDLPGRNMRKNLPILEDLSRKIIVDKAAKEMLNSEKPSESSAHLILAWVVPSWNHPDNYAMRFISEILGGGADSRLFYTLGFEKGLAYYVKSSYRGDFNAGEMSIVTSVPEKRLEDAIETIFNEIDLLKTKKIEERYIEKLKQRAKYHLSKNLEYNEGHISAIEVKLDHGLTPEMYLKGFDEVTSKKLLEVANKYLPDRENGKYVLFIRSPI